MSAVGMSADALDMLLHERPSAPKPAIVRYDWAGRWAQTGVLHLAEESVDFWVSPTAFSNALTAHARRHGLRVKSATFSFEAEDGATRTAVLFVCTNPERTP